MSAAVVSLREKRRVLLSAAVVPLTKKTLAHVGRGRPFDQKKRSAMSAAVVASLDRWMAGSLDP